MLRSRQALRSAALALSLLAGGATLPATAAPATAAAVHLAPGATAKKELRALEAAFQGRIGAYAVDTATGRTVAYRSDERFPLLSTFKALLCGAVLHKARTAEPGLLAKRLHWTADDLVTHSPVTEKHVKDGLTVAALCEATITTSDNTAANVLLKEIGGPAAVTRYLRTLKDPISRLDRTEPTLNDWTPKEKRDTTTPAAAARDLRALTVGDALHPKDRHQLNAWLIANQTGDTRIRAGLPKTWRIGDKTGTNGSRGLANDIAVIWPAKASAPIIMTIYTNRTDPADPVDDKVIASTATILARALNTL
ncbi:class A beta-lactamase [Nonomuraea sp. ATR24]|uniref:class A beta-lactamase n=1 Tax=Nonomuraea TaxID=83681 RepID=UPI001C5DC51F|nr:class A beta-lactamase [Nonomuraea ceibae]